MSPSVSIPGLTPQRVRSATSCERPLAHPAGFIVISDVWRRASENRFVPEHDWQKPLLCPSPLGSRHFGPAPASIADPAVKHVHIYRWGGGGVGDMYGTERRRDTMYSDRVEGLHGKMLIYLCVWEAKEKRGIGSWGQAFGEYTCTGGTWLSL